MSLETSDSDHYPAPLAHCPLMLRGWPFLDSLALYPRRQHLTRCCLLPLASGQAEANSQYKEGETRLLDQWLKTMQNVFQKSKMIISSLEDRAVRQNPTKSWRLYSLLFISVDSGAKLPEFRCLPLAGYDILSRLLFTSRCLDFLNRKWGW